MALQFRARKEVKLSWPLYSRYANYQYIEDTLSKLWRTTMSNSWEAY